MRRKKVNLKFAIIVLCCVIGAATLLWAQPSEIMLNNAIRYHDATFDLQKTRQDVSVKRTYPPVPFNHELHMGKLSCLDCHHDAGGPEKNKLDEALLVNGSPAARCSTCHTDMTSSAKIQEVYHGLCLTCHTKLEKQKKANGLTLCAACHVPQKIKKYQ